MQYNKEFPNKIKPIWTPEKIKLRNEKTKQTCLKKYGVDNPFKSKLIIKKIQLIKIKKYNNPNYNNRTKANNTCLIKYGCKHPIQNQNIQAKITNTRTNHFIKKLFNGTRMNNLLNPLFDPQDYKSVQDLYPFECNICYTIFNSNIEDGKIPKCPSCSPPNNISLMEIEFLNYLKIPPSIENRQKYIKPYKIDGVKGKKIFEFLGDYWHGNPKIFLPHKLNLSNGIPFEDLYTNTMKKFVELKAKGYDIYYIWENDWNQWKRKTISTFPIKKYKYGTI